MRIKSIIISGIIMLTAAHTAFAAETVTDVKFDRKKGEVSYRLMKPALVRISLGVQDGLIFATLADWAPRKKGAHKEKWGGTGSAEFDKLLCNKNSVFSFNYFTTDPDDKPALDIRDIGMADGSRGPIGMAPGDININYFHKGHKREYCREPKVTITLPENIARTDKGVPVIDKPTVLTIEIAPEDKGWFTGERYSLYVFVDTVFAHGAHFGFSPYHWRFDPKGLNKGNHLIVVNLRGFSDHAGIALMPVYVKG